MEQFSEQFDCVGGRKWICKRCASRLSEAARHLEAGYVDVGTAAEILKVKKGSVLSMMARGALDVRTRKGAVFRYYCLEDLKAIAFRKSPEQREIRRRETAARHYQKNKEKVLAYSKQWRKDNLERSRALNNEWRRKHPEVGREVARRGRAKNPDKWKARSVVGNAIRAGKLERGCCVECGAENAEAHHEDHSKPLDIIWLCKKHHQTRHGAKH
jgi:hypothetical protein